MAELVVKSGTAADGSFSAAGATAWNGGMAPSSGVLSASFGGTGTEFFGVSGLTALRAFTFPDANATIARADAGQTFSGNQIFSSGIDITSGALKVATFTWAGKPTAASFGVGYARISDVGPNSAGSLWFSDGANWYTASGGPVVPHRDAHGAVRLLNAPTGTMGANGALTLGTALPETPSQGLWINFPAGAVFAASAAGFYWTTFSTTTLGTVFTDTYVPGTSTFAPPASPTAVLDAGPGAYTGVTSEVTAVSFVLPAGIMLLNGSVTQRLVARFNNSAGTKTIRSRWGGAGNLGVSATTSISLQNMRTVQNRGVANSQISPTATGNDTSSTSGSAVALMSIDTSANVTITLTMQVAVATDLVSIDSWGTLVLPV